MLAHRGKVQKSMCEESYGRKHVLSSGFFTVLPLVPTTRLCKCWFIWGEHSGCCLCLSKRDLVQPHCLQASEESAGTWTLDGYVASQSFLKPGKPGAQPSSARTIGKSQARDRAPLQCPAPPPSILMILLLFFYQLLIASCHSQDSSLCHTARLGCVILQSDFLDPSELLGFLMPILPMMTAMNEWLWVSLG